MSETNALRTIQQMLLAETWKSSDVLDDKTQDQPPEIMSEIFMIICGGNVVLPPQEDHGYPWILGHVCSRWRQILWNSPSIWSKITVGSVWRRPSDPHDPMSSTTSVLTRETLKYIFRRITSPISLNVLGNFADVLDVVLAHVEQFSELSLDDISQSALFHLLDLPGNSFAKLKKLSLSIDYVHQLIPEYATLTTSSFKTAPNLRSVMYKMQQATYIPPLFFLRWERMEEIHVEGMTLSPRTIHDIWRSSSFLVSCSLLLSEIEVIPTSQIITLPNLKTVHLGASYNFDWEGFLNPVMTPTLESLSLTSSQISPRPLTSLIIRLCCSLRTLNIYEKDTNKDDIDGAELEQLFQYLPFLTKLAVSWTIPPSAIRSIHHGALPKLINAEFPVHPEAFGACLDMIDAYIARSLSPRRSFASFEIACYNSPGFTAVRDRYRDSYETYERVEGLRVYVFNKDYYEDTEDQGDESEFDDDEDE